MTTLLALLHLLVAAYPHPAQADEAAAVSIIHERCGSVVESSSPAVQTAISNLHSFGYVLHAMNAVGAELREPTFCTSALALGRNVYGYVEYFVRIDVRATPTAAPAYRFRFVFQDASIQAYHNVIAQPWTGISPADVAPVFERLVESARFRRADPGTPIGADPLAVARASAFYRVNQSELDKSTLSITELRTADSARLRNAVFLVSWLTRPAANPFLGVPRTLGVLVSQDNAGASWIAEAPALATDLRFPLEAARDARAASLPTDRGGWSGALRAAAVEAAPRQWRSMSDQ